MAEEFFARRALGRSDDDDDLAVGLDRKGVSLVLGTVEVRRRASDGLSS